MRVVCGFRNSGGGTGSVRVGFVGFFGDCCCRGGGFNLGLAGNNTGAARLGRGRFMSLMRGAEGNCARSLRAEGGVDGDGGKVVD